MSKHGIKVTIYSLRMSAPESSTELLSLLQLFTTETRSNSTRVQLELNNVYFFFTLLKQLSAWNKILKQQIFGRNFEVHVYVKLIKNYKVVFLKFDRQYPCCEFIPIFYKYCLLLVINSNHGSKTDFLKTFKLVLLNIW